MSLDSNPPGRSAFRHLSSRWLLALCVPVLVALAVMGALKWKGNRTLAGDNSTDLTRAPELDGGTAWLNTSRPIHLKDLRGKVVLLDFWTLCCINCIHTIPDLEKLEKKYPDQLVIIGVHSPKFENEKNTESIRKAILRYEVSHPVVNDADMKIWEAYDVHSWPTLCLIDPEGNYLGQARGEGNYDALDRAISRVIDIHRKKKTLDERPLHFDLARTRERGDGPLFFPGKVLADAAGNRLFIADSTHHRIVITDLDGKKIAIAGKGEPGNADGSFDQAGLNDPQGMALRGETLYVADRKNHLIRALDLKAQTVKTVAGTAGQDRDSKLSSGPALKVGLNSPWDLYLQGDILYIAMAGHHQIWTLDLAKDMLSAWAGNGNEDLVDGSPLEASFAQPSGLTGDGTTLYVADSEVSAIRAIALTGKEEVRTVVGQGLFKFGDVDGVGDEVRLQHPLGVAFHDGKVYVADTFNSKVKVIDPVRRTCATLLGGPDGLLAGSGLHAPGGLSFAGDQLYVADTNAHRICVVDVKTRKAGTLALQGVDPPQAAEKSAPPAPAKEKKTFETSVRKIEAVVEPATAKRGQTVTWKLTVELAPGWHIYPTRQTDAEAQSFVTKIQFPSPGEIVSVGSLQEPTPLTKAEPVAGIAELHYYEGTVVWERPLVVSPDAKPGDKEMEVPVQLLVCDAATCLPAKKMTLKTRLTVTEEKVAVDPKYAKEVEGPGGTP